jgi:hypothetical protein
VIKRLTTIGMHWMMGGGYGVLPLLWGMVYGVDCVEISHYVELETPKG